MLRYRLELRIPDKAQLFEYKSFQSFITDIKKVNQYLKSDYCRGGSPGPGCCILTTSNILDPTGTPSTLKVRV